MAVQKCPSHLRGGCQREKSAVFEKGMSYLGSKGHSTRQDGIFNISICKTACTWKPLLFPLMYILLSFRRFLFSLQLSCFADEIRVCFCCYLSFPPLCPGGLAETVLLTPPTPGPHWVSVPAKPTQPLQTTSCFHCLFEMRTGGFLFPCISHQPALGMYLV